MISRCYYIVILAGGTEVKATVSPTVGQVGPFSTIEEARKAQTDIEAVSEYYVETTIIAGVMSS